MDMTPKPVLCLVGGSGGLPSPFPVGPEGVLVSVPQYLQPGVGGAIVQAVVANVGDVDGIPLSTNPTDTLYGLVAAAVGFAQNYNNAAQIDSLLDGDPTIDGYDPVNIGNTQGSLLVIAQNYAWNGATYDRIRVANVFHTVVATAAGSTAVWTPTAGKSFRLMGYSISVAGTMVATGVQAIKLEDGATVIKNHLATVTITTPTGDTQIGVDLGQGQLSAAVNNVLNINLGTAMATGGVAINVWGTEE